MNNVELKEYWEELLSIYKGILFNNRDFANGGQGSDFGRATNLLSYFAPRITHNGDFKNNIDCNAVDLLEYCLDKPDNGINCLNKSKILQECCLSVGIYARRVWLMPYSPYDTDNHVVVEIFDSELNKWIMLDMTSNGYFVNSDGLPLSVLEIRYNFASNAYCEFIKTAETPDGFFTDMQTERLYYKQYFAKNLCYLFAETRNEFADNDNRRIAFIPKNFDLTRNLKQKSLDEKDVPPVGNISMLLSSPR